MVEAMAAGCVPVAPRRYNYPALVPESLHEACLWREEAFVAHARHHGVAVAAGSAFAIGDGPHPKGVRISLGARVTYLISEIEAFERRVSRHSTFARAYQ